MLTTTRRRIRVLGCALRLLVTAPRGMAVPLLGILAELTVLAAIAAWGSTLLPRTAASFSWSQALLALVTAAIVAGGLVYIRILVITGADARLRGEDLGPGLCMQHAGAQLWPVLRDSLRSATLASPLIAAAGPPGSWGRGTRRFATEGCLSWVVRVLEEGGGADPAGRSRELLEDCWGNQADRMAALGSIGGWVTLTPMLLLLSAAAVTVARQAPTSVSLRLAGGAVVYAATAGIVLLALVDIYRTAVYRYAVDARAPRFFHESDLTPDHGVGGPNRWTGETHAPSQDLPPRRSAPS